MLTDNQVIKLDRLFKYLVALFVIGCVFAMTATTIIEFSDKYGWIDIIVGIVVLVIEIGIFSWIINSFNKRVIMEFKVE